MASSWIFILQLSRFLIGSIRISVTQYVISVRNFLVFSGLAHCLVHVCCRPFVQQEKLHVSSCIWLEETSVFLDCLFLLFSWRKLEKLPLNTTEMCRRLWNVWKIGLSDKRNGLSYNSDDSLVRVEMKAIAVIMKFLY